MCQLILTFFHHRKDNTESTLLISSYRHIIGKCKYKGSCDTCDTLNKLHLTKQEHLQYRNHLIIIIL